MPPAQAEYEVQEILNRCFDATNNRLNVFPQIRDDESLLLGTDSDIALRLRSTVLGANTALTGVLVGTPVTPIGPAANSLIISNITASGDILIAVNKGGTSYMAFMADASTGDTLVGVPTGQSFDVYIAGVKEIDYAAGAMEFQQATTISTTATTLTLSPSTDVHIADAKGLVIGHTAQLNFGALAELQITGTALADSSMSLARYSADANPPWFFTHKSRGATIGTNTIVVTGDDLFILGVTGNDGTAGLDTLAAALNVQVDGVPGLNDMPGRFVFQTHKAGDAEGVTERWRITGVGVLTSVAGTPANAATADGSVLATGGIAFTDVANAWIDDASQGTGTVTHYIGNNSINVTAPSDERLKENFVPYQGSVMEAIKTLEFQTFDYLPEGLRLQHGRTFGLTAQGVRKVLPEYVFTRTDDYLQIAYHEMMPVALRGLQEHEDRIARLERQLVASGIVPES